MPSASAVLLAISLRPICARATLPAVGGRKEVMISKDGFWEEMLIL